VAFRFQTVELNYYFLNCLIICKQVKGAKHKKMSRVDEFKSI